MESQGQSAASPNFETAGFTAIVSDLHLCEEEPVHPKFPLWKKYKTRQFFFDDDFNNFLRSIVHKAQGESVELVLNGDIFDFDSCTSLPKNPPTESLGSSGAAGFTPKKKNRFLKYVAYWLTTKSG